MDAKAASSASLNENLTRLLFGEAGFFYCPRSGSTGILPAFRPFEPTVHLVADGVPSGCGQSPTRCSRPLNGGKVRHWPQEPNPESKIREELANLRGFSDEPVAEIVPDTPPNSHPCPSDSRAMLSVTSTTLLTSSVFSNMPRRAVSAPSMRGKTAVILRPLGLRGRVAGPSA